MEHIFKYNDIIIVERKDLGAERIPVKYRLYINQNTYIYFAKIIKICENKSYHRVKPIPLKDDFIGTRKAYKSKIYKKINI